MAMLSNNVQNRSNSAGWFASKVEAKEKQQACVKLSTCTELALRKMK